MDKRFKSKITPVSTSKSFFKKTWLVALLLTVVSLAIIFFVSIYLRNRDHATELQVAQTRDVIKQLVTELKTVDEDASWVDTSYCGVYEPRTFGDTTSYACYVSYKTEISISNINQVQNKVAGYQAIMADNSLIEPAKLIASNSVNDNLINSKKDYIASSDFIINKLRTDKCDINYSYAISKSEILNIELGCNQKTYQAYFEPIKYE